MKRALLAALCAALLVPATADAAAKRVVAIEWDTVENLHMLGMAPVGAADMKGYDTWVAAPRPRGMKDIGSRQSPSLERIAALKPDLIVVPDYRSTKNLAQLKRIAPVLVTHPYPASGSQLTRWSRTSGGSPRRSAARSRGEQRAAGPLQHARAQQGEAQARRPRGRGGGDLDARRHDAARPRSACSRRTRRPPTWSAGSGCATAGAGRARYGFATIGLEGAVARERLARVRLPAAVLAPGLRHHAARPRTSGCRS